MVLDNLLGLFVAHSGPPRSAFRSAFFRLRMPLSASAAYRETMPAVRQLFVDEKGGCWRELRLCLELTSRMKSCDFGPRQVKLELKECR